jgi:hypothetical protein
MYSASCPIATETLGNAQDVERRCGIPENELTVGFGTEVSLATLPVSNHRVDAVKI